MRRLGLWVLIVLALALTSAWGWAAVRGVTVVWGNYSYHAVGHGWIVEGTVFSTAAEDDYYQALRIPIWLPPALLLGMAGVVLWVLKRTGHPEGTPGFPVENGTAQR